MQYRYRPVCPSQTPDEIRAYFKIANGEDRPVTNASVWCGAYIRLCTSSCRADALCMLGTPDFSPEEEEEVRRENQWAFE